MIAQLLTVLSLLNNHSPLQNVNSPDICGLQATVTNVSLHSDSAIELIYEVADITGDNIIVQGSPKDGHVEIVGSYSKAKLYDKLGKVTGFTWRLGKSKFVLFEKNFEDELDLPEVNFPEFINSLISSRRILSLYFTPDPRHPYTYDMLTAICNSLPTNQQELVKKGGVSLSQLSSENKALASYATYHGKFNLLYDKLVTIPIFLQNIDNGYVHHAMLMYSNGKQHDVIDLRFNSANDILRSYRNMVEVQPVLVDDSISSSPLHDLLSQDVSVTTNANPAVFRKFGTLSDVLTEVNIKYHLLSKPLADFDKRHVLVAMNSSGVSSLMEGIAELHNWSIGSTTIDKNVVATLTNTKRPIPKDVYGVGDYMVTTLPTDIKNWLFRSKSIVQSNLKLTEPNSSLYGPNKDLEISAERSRLQRNKKSLNHQVREAFKSWDIGTKKRIGDLPIPLRKLIYNWEFVSFASALFDELWIARNIDVSYIRHPEQSLLFEENGFYGIKGPDGRSFGVRMGPH